MLNATFFEGLQDSLDTIRIEQCSDLDLNQWARLGQSVGGPNSRVKNLLLYNNRFSFRYFNFTGLVNLERIVLRKNLFTVIETDLTAFANLQILDVSENNLISFIVTGYAPKLTALYLNNNSISFIFQRVFDDTITGVKTVDLTG
jgi:Leucine-rich repeat (LRR) protein